MHLISDSKKCTGCRVCLTICSISHFKEVNTKKAALAIDAQFPSPGHYDVKVCNQCGTCASVCPAEAIELKNGVYIIDGDKCTGCGSCVEECPLKVMFMHDDSTVPIKCDLCKECIAMCGPKVLSIKE
ncbi:MAG: 4Fe-4S binding protein [Candidatus Brocadiia bacterium]